MDGFGEIGVFVRVVDAHGFTKAAKSLGLTASGVSRIVSRLEARLGARLLDRTTRSVGLTAEGAAYYERCTKILHELEDANVALASARETPRGRLRVDAPSALGRMLIAPAVPRFLEANPALSLDLSLRDHLIDPIAEGIDIVLRMAEPRDSELVAKKVGTLLTRVVASPQYLKRRGRPRAPEDIRKHETIAFLAGGSLIAWRFRARGREIAITPSGRLHSNSTDAIRASALAGLGLAQILEGFVRDDIARGDLEVVLPELEAPPRTVYALYTRDKAKLPKVRVFLDLMIALFQTSGLAPKRPSRRLR